MSRTMDGGLSLCLFLMVVWCLSGGVLMIISAQPTVTAWIVTPEADRKEGGRVEMLCVATNLEAYHIMEWRTEDPISTLRWGNITLAGADWRFMFKTIHTRNMQTIQSFNITDLQRRDTDEYICNVRDPVQGGGNLIVATSKVKLTVLYFPCESFPICSPDEPITADTGTQLSMRCSSESGNSAVMMHVSQPTSLNTNMYRWMISSKNDTRVASLDLTVDIEDHNALFQCIITSTDFPGMNRSCTIGPIQTPSSIKSTASVAVVATTSINSTSINPSATALIAGASAGGVTALILLVVLILICRRRGLCNSQSKPPAPHNQQAPDPAGDTVLTAEQTEHSQPNIYQESNQQTQASLPVTGVNIYYDPSEVSLTASPLPDLGTSLMRREANGAPPLYATPHRDSTSNCGYGDEHFRQSMDHRYRNHVFNPHDSDPTPGLSEDSTRPTAMVPPMQGAPIKPEPYKPKSQRVNTQDRTHNQQDH